MALGSEAPAHQRQASQPRSGLSRTASGLDCGWTHPGCPALGRNPTAIAREEVANVIGRRTIIKVERMLTVPAPRWREGDEVVAHRRR